MQEFLPRTMVMDDGCIVADAKLLEAHGLEKPYGARLPKSIEQDWIKRKASSL